MDKATLTCPQCGHKQETDIPQNGCLAFFKCDGCNNVIPVPKDSKHCCVVCEYSDKSCPVGQKK